MAQKQIEIECRDRGNTIGRLHFPLSLSPVSISYNFRPTSHTASAATAANAATFRLRPTETDTGST